MARVLTGMSPEELEAESAAADKLRTYRAVAARTEKRDFVYRGTIDVASIHIWTRDLVFLISRDTP